MSKTNKMDSAVKGANEFANVGTKAAETFVKASTEAATKGYEQFVSASADAFKGYENVAGLSKESVDAVVRSSAIVAKGFETVSTRFFELAKTQFEQNVAASKALFGCKSVKEVFDLQSNLVRASLDKVVSESAALTELSAKVAHEAIAPIATSMTSTFEKFAKVQA